MYEIILLCSVDLELVTVDEIFLVAAERPSKKEEAFREERRRLDPTGPSARGGHPMPRSGPGNRAPNSLHPPPTAMGPPGSHGGSGSHKDIKLTLLTKVILMLQEHKCAGTQHTEFCFCFTLVPSDSFYLLLQPAVDTSFPYFVCNHSVI